MFLKGLSLELAIERILLCIPTAVSAKHQHMDAAFQGFGGYTNA